MLDQHRWHTSAGRCLRRMWIIAIVLLGVGVVSCERQYAADTPPDTQQFNHEVRSKPLSRLHHMVEAYKSGEIDAARSAARKYLEQRHQQRVKAKSDSDRFAWISAVFAVLKNMLHYENQLPPSLRLGDDPEFVDWIQEVLLETWAAAGDIEKASVGMQDLIKRSQGIVAREWLRARGARVPREELEELYLVFQADLEAQGLLSVGSVLAYAPPEPPSRPKARKIDQIEAEKIMTAIRSFIRGMTTSDLSLIHSVTGCTPEECQSFLDNVEEEAAEEGGKSFKTLILPKLTSEQMRLRPLPWGERTYRISFSDVTFIFVLPNGDEIEKQADKWWTIREDDNGKWLVLPFK